MIIDDELDARTLLKQYVAAYPEYTIVGEASNGLEAVEKINTLKPNYIFLDIQMPGLNGFQVLTRLEEIPQVIFSTAYDQYAIQAFEINAIDYLLKPYGRKRFENTFDRIIQNYQNLEALTESLLDKEQRVPTKIILHKGRRKLLMSPDSIFFGEAFGDYTKVITEDEEYLSTKGISDLLSKLDSNNFVRVHRSHFINIQQAKELKKIDRYYYVIFSNDQRVRVSETHFPKLRHLIY